MTEFIPIILSATGAILSAIFTIIAWSINRHIKKFDIMSDKLENLSQIVIKNEATTKIQQDIILEHIRSIVKIDSKLDAIFRYIDAPKRKSDN